MDYLIYRQIVIISCLLILQACESNDNGPIETITFNKLIELRLADDQHENGSKIEISAILRSDLLPIACPAVITPPCVENTDSVDLSDYTIINNYGHYNNSTNELCYWPRIFIYSTNYNYYEKLQFDYHKYKNLINVSENSEVATNFIANVEYIDSVDHCAKKIYKGMNITLSEGEHERIFDLFNDK